MVTFMVLVLAARSVSIFSSVCGRSHDGGIFIPVLKILSHHEELLKERSEESAKYKLCENGMYKYFVQEIALNEWKHVR